MLADPLGGVLGGDADGVGEDLRGCGGGGQADDRSGAVGGFPGGADAGHGGGLPGAGGADEQVERGGRR